MNIKTTTSHEIKFTVEAFWNEEGGMGTDQFGGEVDSLPEAIKLLELAKVKEELPKFVEWVIVGHVKTNVS